MKNSGGKRGYSRYSKCAFSKCITYSLPTQIDDKVSPGLLHDLPTALERIAPRETSYEHDKRWHDGNGHSHVRASILGPSLTVPFEDGKLILGTWQQIIFIELDVRARTRDLVVQIIGE